MNQWKGIDVRVLFVSDISGPASAAGQTPPPRFARAHADSDLVEALQSSGIEIARAEWGDLARGAVDLDGVDVVHLRPAVLRRGPRSGDRRSDGRRLTLRRRPSDGAALVPAERRTAAGLLSHVPLDLPIVLTLPTRPAGPIGTNPVGTNPVGTNPVGMGPTEISRVEPGPGAPGSRAVHVIAADAEAAGGLDTVLPDSHAASVALIGRGFGDPTRARAFDVESAVVLASTSPGAAREAAAVLRAVEMLGHAGLRFSLVLAGVGPMVRGVQRRVALAEAAGIDVRLLGRASADELARWRATATACVVTSREPDAQREVADILLSGIPVIATLDPVHAEVAAQTNVLPRWFADGDAAGLAARLLESLSTFQESPAGEREAVPARAAVLEPAGPAEPVALVEPVAPAGRDAVPGGPFAATAGGLALLARSEPAAVSPGTGSQGIGSPGAVGPGAVSRDAVGPGAVGPGAVSPVAVSPVAVSPVEVLPGDRVLPTWNDIADQTRWVYQQALRSGRS